MKHFWLPALLGLALGAGASGCEGRKPGAHAKAREHDRRTGPALVEINLSHGLPELGASSLFGAPSGGGHSELVRTLAHLDPDAKGVFVRIGTAPITFTIAREIGGLLADMKDKGIPVVCHADEIQNGTLLLMSRGCSEIWLSPAGQVESVGIAAQLIFGKSILKKLGVGVDFLQVGKYKGAQEPFTRDEPSPEARESLEGTLRDIRSAWVTDINAGRKRELTDAVEDGPHTAEAAKTLGLIDQIGYLDEARDSARKLASAERTLVAFGGHADGGGGIGDVLRSLAGGDVTAEPHVAIVRAVGAITMGGGGANPFGGSSGITEQSLGRTLTELTNDDAVKAVVLRIDSPGGSALASDLLWHKLMLLRARKPLIISVGGMAASGGYYLSCAGNRIFAEPTSIVGSVGVVGGKFAIHDPLASIGINTVTIAAATDPKKAARASYMSPFDSWDDATRAKVLTSMQGIYDTFVARISEGRGLDKAVVAAFAEGRIFGGATAKDKHLVDELGGLTEAVSYALKESALGVDGNVILVGERASFAELLGGGSSDEDTSRAEIAQSQVASAAHALSPMGGLERTLPPEAIVWLGSAWPMAGGEGTLAALPFAVILR